MKTFANWLVVLIPVLISASGCTNDKDLKIDLHSRVKDDINFAAVQYTINNGWVTLTGSCSSQQSKDKAEALIKTINLVKGIHDNIVIQPVTLTSVTAMQYEADSVLAGFPMAVAVVTDNSVIVSGTTNNKESEKLFTSLRLLSIPKIDNRLHVR